MESSLPMENIISHEFDSNLQNIEHSPASPDKNNKNKSALQAKRRRNSEFHIKYMNKANKSRM